eukprot:371619_1
MTMEPRSPSDSVSSGYSRISESSKAGRDARMFDHHNRKFQTRLSYFGASVMNFCLDLLSQSLSKIKSAITANKKATNSVRSANQNIESLTTLIGQCHRVSWLHNLSVGDSTSRE